MRAITNNSLQHMGIPGMKWGRKKISSLVSKYKEHRRMNKELAAKKEIQRKMPDYKYNKSRFGALIAEKVLNMQAKDSNLKSIDAVKKIYRGRLITKAIVLGAVGATIAGVKLYQKYDSSANRILDASGNVIKRYL